MVTLETLDGVAALARLQLREDERQTFARHLSQILEYADSLLELDTSDVPPMTAVPSAGSLREDVPEASLPREAILSEAPDAEDDLFRVPKVLGG